MRISPLALALLLASAALGALETGETAPKFANPDTAGRHTFSSAVLGQGPVILDFFATDCVPCMKELPELEALYEQFKDRRLRVVVFATDPTGAAIVKPFFDARPTPLTILIDRYRVTTERFGVTEIPTVFLIDRAGEVLVKGIGYRHEVIEEMRAVLAGL